MKQTHCLLLLLLLSLKSTNSVLGCTVSEPAGLSILPVEAPAAFITVYIYIYNTTASSGPSNPPPPSPPTAARREVELSTCRGLERPASSINETPGHFLCSSLFPPACLLPAASLSSVLARSASLSPPRPRGGIPDVRTAAMGTQAPENYPAEKVQVPPSPSICPPWSCCFAGQPWRPARFST